MKIKNTALEDAIKRTKYQIDISTQFKEDPNEASWNSQEGVLISINEAKTLLDAIEVVESKDNYILITADCYGCTQTNECKDLREVFKCLNDASSDSISEAEGEFLHVNFVDKLNKAAIAYSFVPRSEEHTIENFLHEYASQLTQELLEEL